MQPKVNPLNINGEATSSFCVCFTKTLTDRWMLKAPPRNSSGLFM